MQKFIENTTSGGITANECNRKLTNRALFPLPSFDQTICATLYLSTSVSFMRATGL